MTITAEQTAATRDAWDAIATDFDRHDTPWTTELARRALAHVPVEQGTRFLDVASGSGGLALAAAERGARVTATDLSPRMLELLRARADVVVPDAVTTRVMDGHALELGDDAFDVAASQNGVSVFPDMGRGIAEMVRVTRPGGHVVVVAFGPLPQVELVGWFLGAIRAASPDGGTAQGGPPLPFQAADPAVLSGHLADAGLRDVVLSAVDWRIAVEDVDHLWRLVTSSNPIARRLVAALPPGRVEDVRRVLDGMLRERSGGAAGAYLDNRLHVAVGVVP